MAKRDIGCRIAAVELRKKEFRKGYGGQNCGRIAMHIPIKDGLSIAWTVPCAISIGILSLCLSLIPFPFPPPPLPQSDTWCIQGATYACRSVFAAAQAQGRIRVWANEMSKRKLRPA